MTPEAKKPGQESVWDYPRPALAQACQHHLLITHNGVTVAETRHGARTLETSHPPSYYFPREDIAMDLIEKSSRNSFCEWKGQASYMHVRIGHEIFRDVGWSYLSPTTPFQMLKDHIAFYASPFDGCFVNGEKVIAQPGLFYGGWITSSVAGPFKGALGSMLW
jgi:uncharacterized protein (DUF427 family)